jgi:type II secretory pathway component GspD/PulD (secretin)
VARSRTEIAIFLTPYVVYTDEEADSLMQRERGLLRESKEKIDSVLPSLPTRKP